jgi:hypothetical protein
MAGPRGARVATVAVDDTERRQARIGFGQE